MKTIYNEGSFRVEAIENGADAGKSPLLCQQSVADGCFYDYVIGDTGMCIKKDGNVLEIYADNGRRYIRATSANWRKI